MAAALEQTWARHPQAQFLGARGEVAGGLRRVESARALEADVLRRYQAGDFARINANLAQGERLAAEAEMTETEIA